MGACASAPVSPPHLDGAGPPKKAPPRPPSAGDWGIAARHAAGVPLALGALSDPVGADDDVPGARTPGRPPHTRTPPTLLQAPAGVLPRASCLDYAPPYIPPPGLPPPGLATGAGGVEPPFAPARRKAVIVAVSRGPGGGAPRAVADADCVRLMLERKFGFQPGHTIFLHDAQPHAALLPSRAHILAAARWLTDGAAPGDSLVFAFFGPGGDGGGEPLVSPARAAATTTKPRRPSSGGDAAAFFTRGARRAAAAAAADGWAATLLPCDGAPITPPELRRALVDPLPAGARLLAAVDAAGGRFSLGLPAAAALRADGWPGWEGPAAVGPPAACAGDAVLLAGDARPAAAGAADGATSTQPSGDLAFCLVQAVEQGHAGSVAALARAMRYAARNGPAARAGGGDGGRPPALSASRRFDLGRPFVL